MKFKDQLFILGKTIFEELFQIKIPKPEITRCPYCNWSLNKVHQCHHIELNRPEFFYICNGSNRHVFGTQQELREAFNEVQMIKSTRKVTR